MKALFFACLFYATLVWADGPVTEQAVKAGEVAVAHFNKVQPHSVRKLFKTLTVEMTGHEQMAVELRLQNGQAYNYDCRENETVKPVIWECQTLN